MGPLLHLTLVLSRLARRRWTRIEAAFALGALALAVAIVLAERFGYWPDWMHARGPGGVGRR